MIPEPHPYDPDDPTYDDRSEDLRYLVPQSRRWSSIDPVDPLED